MVGFVGDESQWLVWNSEAKYAHMGSMFKTIVRRCCSHVTPPSPPLTRPMTPLQSRVPIGFLSPTKLRLLRRSGREGDPAAVVQ